jgi:hypothetical protein
MNCTECGGLGCDSCCFTGLEYTPQEQREYRPYVGAADTQTTLICPDPDALEDKPCGQ